MSGRSNPSSAMSPTSYTSPPFLDSSSSSRRPARFSTVSSLAIPPAVSPLDLPRRVSGMSLPQGVGKMHRKVSNAASGSGSGISTPDYARRARRLAARAASGTGTGIGTGTGAGQGAGVGGQGQRTIMEEKDWAGIEPDEIFRTLPVQEVRKVEAKMRADALNKQSELRSMVGTRYRDLLTSATQITSLHSSSLKLSENLKTLSQACNNPAEASILMDEAGETSEAEEVANMLPVAAHMKLLLDAPEALYSRLAHHAYLHAAFLWLVTRVVKESLSNMPEDVNEPYLPLLHKQWETLLPFRSHIVQRATAALRSRETTDPKTLSETLLAIILLDNLPISDALSLLLSQRTKTIRDILAHPTEPTTPKVTLSPRARRRTLSRARGPAQEREAISAVLSDAVRCLLDTVDIAGQVFAAREKTGTKESLLEEMMRLVQVGEPAPVTQQAPVRRSSQQRRTSRMLSISLTMPQFNLSADSPPISTPQVLQSLPSAQILLRHLPSSITGFTPFIASSSAPALADKLAAWQTSSTDLLREAAPSWLADLQSVSDVWRVRSSVVEVLQGDDPRHSIREALEDEWAARTRDVWDKRLENLVEVAEAHVREAGEAMRQNVDDLDSNPEGYMFSDVTFPSAPTSTLVGSTTTFASFLSDLKRRAAYRTPRLDAVLSVLEKTALDLKVDMRGLPEQLHEDYGVRVQGMLGRLVGVLEKVLESMGPVRGDGKLGIEAELFVGRVALFIAKSSSFLGDVVGESTVETSDVVDHLLRVHESSTSRWRGRAVEEAVTKLAPIFDPLRGPREVRASWQGPHPVAPSAPVMVALQSLVSSVRHLGLPQGVTLPITPRLVEAFVDQAAALEGWKTLEAEGALQAAMDLAFLILLTGGRDDIASTKMLTKAKDADIVSEDFPTQLPTLTLDSLRRTQLLLHPLIAHLDPAELGPTPKPSGPDARMASLLRFGPPASKGGVGGTEFRSPLAVSRPAKRFGLLSIAT